MKMNDRKYYAKVKVFGTLIGYGWGCGKIEQEVSILKKDNESLVDVIKKAHNSGDFDGGAKFSAEESCVVVTLEVWKKSGDYWKLHHSRVQDIPLDQFPSISKYIM